MPEFITVLSGGDYLVQSLNFGGEGTASFAALLPAVLLLVTVYLCAYVYKTYSIIETLIVSLYH